MRPHQARFVTACQQLLALGVVLAVLTPAAGVVSLDVIGLPGTAPSAAPPAATAPTLGQDSPATEGGNAAAPGADASPAPSEQASPAPRASVPVGTVEPTVTEVPMTAEAPAPSAGTEDEPADDPTEAPDTEPGETRERRAARSTQGSTEEATRTTVVSEPQPVEGYGAVGITWSHQDQVDDDAITLEVRTLQDGAWSGWTDVEYHEEHAPDPATTEGASARPGTDPLLVGEVDQVQARAVAPEGLPRDMSLAVVEPGEAEQQRSEAPELSMGEAPATRESGETGGASGSEGAIELQAAVSAPKPTIFSRSQWGADERLRDGSPSYGSISAGFVHHTVNGNDYTRAQVPGIIRGIYAYHTRSRGWSDIGYNFLVDKFGRIWEGRYGGVARPVIGAHTLGYNHASFAMSAIGNFDTVRPPQVMLEAYGDLFAWKLGLHDVAADDMSQTVAGDRFAAINGHRDAGSTACPGRYLYARLDAIRDLAAQAQDAPEEPEEPKEEEPEPLVPQQLDSDITGTPHPDLVVRRASDGRGLVVPTGGHTRFKAPAELATGRWDRRAPVATPDLTGDGVADLLTIDATGALEIRPGRSDGGFTAPVRVVRSFRGHELPAAVGDVTGEGRGDVVGRRRGALVVFTQGRSGRYRLVEAGVGLRGVTQLSGAGDVTGDKRRDLWGLDRKGQLLLFRGLGSGRFSSRTVMPGDWSGVDQVAGGVDYTQDGIADLVARRGDGALVVRSGRGDGSLGPALGPTAQGGTLRMISGAGQVSGSGAPDLVAVDADGALVTLTNHGTFDLGRPIDTGRSFGRANLLLNAGDFDGDGHGDVILRRPRGPLLIFRGTGTGRLKEPVKIGRRGFRTVTGLRTVADLTGDRAPDLLGVRDGTTYVWTGKGAAMLGEAKAVTVAQDPAARVKGSYDWIIRTSDLSLKGPADLVVRDRETGHLYRINGTRSTLRAPRFIGEGRAWNLGG
jgi:hypothetical protein